MTSAIALLSGGLDSSVATGLAARDHTIAQAITIDYGQRAAIQEIAAARAFCSTRRIPHEVIALPFLADISHGPLTDRHIAIPETTPATVDDHAADRARAVWVPNRNGLFIAIAAAIAEARGCKAIVAGFNREEAATFPDNSQPFIEATNAALSLSTLAKVTVESPTATMTKEAIARSFVALELDPAALWCCYDGGEKLCGRCESCARTIRAFRAAGAWELIRNRFALPHEE